MDIVEEKSELSRCWLAMGRCGAAVLASALCVAGTLAFGYDSGEAGGSTNDAKRSEMSSLLSGKPAELKGANKVSEVEATGDSMDYDRKTGWITARGHVVVRKGEEELRADYVQVNTYTKDAEARGNVILKRPGLGIWRGPKLRYNFDTGIGDIPELIGDISPFHVESKNTQRRGNEYVMTDALVTTCTNKPGGYHYHVTATKLDVRPGDDLEARNAVFYIGPVPIMYMPYWRRNLKDDFGFRLFAGASSKMGAFLLTSYRYPITATLKGETHLDYRTRRGVAVGQDLRWMEPDGSNYGELTGYYLNDKKPKEDTDPESLEVDSNRYRVKLKDAYNATSMDYVLLQAQYLSDVKMLEDFFEDEYRESTQPDNYASYTHRGESYTLNLLARARLNDFYSNVNRLPEASVVFSRQELGDSVFYYDGQTAAAFLQKVWEEGSTEEDYSAFRFDSSHMIYYPTKQFGFLNVIPRSGYRATYYSATPGTVDEGFAVTTNYTVSSSGTTNSSVSTNAVTRNVEKSGELRSLFEVGMETSFKAFNVWETEDGMPLRHIVEPYANYTFVAEPTLLPENVYQFDEVDTLGKQHAIKVGARNKIQTKNGDQLLDFIDLDAYTILNIERSEDQAFFDYIYFKGQINTLAEMKVDFDGIYSVQDSLLDTFNAQLTYSDPETYSTSVDFRFKTDDSTLVSEDTTFYLSRTWYLNLYARYEFEGGQLEEVGGYLQRNFDCMSLRTGAGLLPGYTESDGTQIEDEWRLTFEFWITAFPEMRIAGKHRK